MEISREIFDQQRLPRFGNANPERMTLAFWEWMIRGEGVPPINTKSRLGELGLRIEEGKLKSAYGPFRARDAFNIPLNREDGPIWTFDRMGATSSRLRDGRVIYIGGEHEDFYDPDFYIYNDVVALGPDGRLEIYGYPKEVFPPTDFHSATVVGDRILVVGGLGYKNERRFGHTPVYALDLSNYRMSEIPTSGEMPGWISEHEASYDPTGIITIRGGQILDAYQSEQRTRRNFEDYALDINSYTWKRLTSRNWREFSIRQEKGAFVLDHKPEPKTLLPGGIEYISLPPGTNEDSRFLVAEVPVSLTIRIARIELIVEGSLPEPLLDQLVEEIRANAEAAVKRRCILKEI
jgi:hypothetical protein